MLVWIEKKDKDYLLIDFPDWIRARDFILSRGLSPPHYFTRRSQIRLFNFPYKRFKNPTIQQKFWFNLPDKLFDEILDWEIVSSIDDDNILILANGLF